MALCERRMSSSTAVTLIWDTMAAIRSQKQSATQQRIQTFSKRVGSQLSEETINEQLILMVIDNLLKKNKKVEASKDSYAMPDKEFDKGAHDWYCFECHTSGKVLCCSSCYRVYHPSCIEGRNSKEVELICKICKMVNSDKNLKLEAEDMKTFLAFTCQRLKEKGSPHMHKIPKASTERWQLDYLLYKYVDLATMEAKVEEGQYKNLEEFYADTIGIVHNAGVYYGADNQKTIAARQLMKDCAIYLDEIRNCPNCYRMSSEKSDKFWFCKPCNPPHELVYAKQTGYPYWPAKVINKTEDSYHVRFFGTAHQRAVVPKAHVKPISCDTLALGIKRTSAWKKACEQLAHHQKLLSELPVGISVADEASKIIPGPESPPAKRKKVAAPSPTDSNPIQQVKDEPEEIPVLAAEEGDGNFEAPLDESFTTCALQMEEESNKYLPSADSHNVVSSTQDSIIEGFISTATQTLKPPLLEKISSKFIQTDFDKAVDEKISKTQLAAEIKSGKDKAIRAITTKLEKKHSEDKEKAVAVIQKELIKCQEDHQRELEKNQEDHQREVKAVHATYQKQLAEAKKKQWCYNCEREAVYHCCWNTSYCSVECQQVHWQKEHKRNCRRKRNINQHNQTN